MGTSSGSERGTAPARAAVAATAGAAGADAIRRGSASAPPGGEEGTPQPSSEAAGSPQPASAAAHASPATAAGDAPPVTDRSPSDAGDAAAATQPPAATHALGNAAEAAAAAAAAAAAEAPAPPLAGDVAAARALEAAAGAPARVAQAGAQLAASAPAQAAALAAAADGSESEPASESSDAETGTAAAAAAAAAAGGGGGGKGKRKGKPKPPKHPRPEKGSFRGVFWDAKSGRWRSQLGHKNQKLFMGYFEDPAEAARAYDEKAVEIHGAAAKTNFDLSNYISISAEARAKTKALAIPLRTYQPALSAAAPAQAGPAAAGGGNGGDGGTAAAATTAAAPPPPAAAAASGAQSEQPTDAALARAADNAAAAAAAADDDAPAYVPSPHSAALAAELPTRPRSKRKAAADAGRLSATVALMETMEEEEDLDEPEAGGPAAAAAAGGGAGWSADGSKAAPAAASGGGGSSSKRQRRGLTGSSTAAAAGGGRRLVRHDADNPLQLNDAAPPMPFNDADDLTAGRGLSFEDAAAAAGVRRPLAAAAAATDTDAHLAGGSMEQEPETSAHFTRSRACSLKPLRPQQQQKHQHQQPARRQPSHRRQLHPQPEQTSQAPSALESLGSLDLRAAEALSQMRYQPGAAFPGWGLGGAPLYFDEAGAAAPADEDDDMAEAEPGAVWHGAGDAPADPALAAAGGEGGAAPLHRAALTAAFTQGFPSAGASGAAAASDDDAGAWGWPPQQQPEWGYGVSAGGFAHRAATAGSGELAPMRLSPAAAAAAVAAAAAGGRPTRSQLLQQHQEQHRPQHGLYLDLDPAAAAATPGYALPPPTSCSFMMPPTPAAAIAAALLEGRGALHAGPAPQQPASAAPLPVPPFEAPLAAHAGAAPPLAENPQHPLMMQVAQLLLPRAQQVAQRPPSPNPPSDEARQQQAFASLSPQQLQQLAAALTGKQLQPAQASAAAAPQPLQQPAMGPPTPAAGSGPPHDPQPLAHRASSAGARQAAPVPAGSTQRLQPQQPGRAVASGADEGPSSTAAGMLQHGLAQQPEEVQAALEQGPGLRAMLQAMLDVGSKAAPATAARPDDSLEAQLRALMGNPTAAGSSNLPPQRTGLQAAAAGGTAAATAAGVGGRQAPQAPANSRQREAGVQPPARAAGAPAAAAGAGSSRGRGLTFYGVPRPQPPGSSSRSALVVCSPARPKPEVTHPSRGSSSGSPPPGNHDGNGGAGGAGASTSRRRQPAVLVPAAAAAAAAAGNDDPGQQQQGQEHAADNGLQLLAQAHQERAAQLQAFSTLLAAAQQRALQGPSKEAASQQPAAAGGAGAGAGAVPGATGRPPAVADSLTGGLLMELARLLTAGRLAAVTHAAAEQLRAPAAGVAAGGQDSPQQPAVVQGFVDEGDAMEEEDDEAEDQADEMEA